jgi:hypothetical protein
MDGDDDHLTPQQERAIMRIQLVGVVSLIVSVTAVTIAFNTDMRGKWGVLAFAIISVGVLLVASTLFVARTEHRRAREVVSRGLREIGDDTTKFIRRATRRSLD